MLLQPANDILYFGQNSVMMCSKYLVIINDPLTFEVTDFPKYFLKFMKLIGPDTAVVFCS